MGVTVFQVIMAYLVRDSSWWTIAVLGYVISATCNQNLFCAQHELSHFLALKKPAHNKVRPATVPCFANAPAPAARAQVTPPRHVDPSFSLESREQEEYVPQSSCMAVRAGKKSIREDGNLSCRVEC